MRCGFQRSAISVLLLAAIGLVALGTAAAASPPEGRPPRLGHWKLRGSGNGFVVKAKGKHLVVVDLKTRFSSEFCDAYPGAQVTVAGPLPIKRHHSPNSADEYSVGGFTVAEVEGEQHKAQLSIVFGSIYPTQIFGGTFGFDGCQAEIRGHYG
jgi:hypothetical protein